MDHGSSRTDGPERRTTFCRICEASCGLVAEVQDGRVQKLVPDPDHPVSQGFVCVKGVRYTDVHHSPDRVTTPLKRVGDDFQPIGWAQALDEIGARVRQLRTDHGDQSVGLYVGNPAALSPLHLLFANSFALGLGTRHVYTSGSQDCNNKFRASQEMFGSPMLQPIPDIDRTRCAILVGCNPAISQFSIVNLPRAMDRLKGVERAGGKVVFVNPRRTESARQVGEQMFIRPGTDLFFFLSFAQQLVEQGGVVDAVRPCVDSLESFGAFVQPWTPERTAEVTGIEAGALRELVRTYREAGPALLYASTGVNQGPHGTLCLWLLNAINLLAGNLDRPGGMLITAQSVRTARLGYPTGDAIPRTRSRVGGFEQLLGSMPAGVLPDEVLTPGEGQLRALFVTAGNPLLTCPNSARMQKALRALDLLVTVDLFRNETGELADYVLPATSFLERDDMPMGMGGYQPVPYAQFAPAVVEPLGQARDEWWIFTHLARVCRAPLHGVKPLQWWMNVHTRLGGSWLPGWLTFKPRWLLAANAWLAGTSLRSLLKRHPSGRALPAPEGGQLLGKRVFTPSGRVDLMPAAFVKHAGQLSDWYDGLRARAEGLTLITKRERTSHNSWMHNVESFVAGARSTNYLYMHPTDARSRGLSEGMLCEVSTSVGQVQLPLKTTEDLMPGTVAVPHGWGHQSARGLTVARQTGGVNVNLMSPDGPEALEPLAGMAHLTALSVQVRAVVTAGTAKDARP